MSQRKVLFVLTSHNKLGSLGKPTGWYLPEFAHPYHVISPHADVVVASPAGGEAPLDPSSVESFKGDEQCQAFLKENEALWKNTEKLSNFVGRAKEFDAILYVGGHGRAFSLSYQSVSPLTVFTAMFDLATDATSHQVIKEFYESGRVVSAVCHGPAALANVKLSDGSYLVANEPVTGFSNTEEDGVGLSQYMPFMLETLLGQNGAKFEKAAEPWGEKVVIAGKNSKLITGQNPASAGPIGKAVLKAMASST